MSSNEYAKLHYLHLHQGTAYIVSDDDMVHWEATPFSYKVKPIKPYKPEVTLDLSTMVGNVRIENNTMVQKGNFSSIAQTLYYEFEPNQFESFIKTLKELIPECFVDEESALKFEDDSRLSLKFLPFFLSQFDGPYAWLCLFKAQKDGFALLTDGKTQLTHLDQLESPMKEQLQSLTKYIELFDLKGHEFNGEAYAFSRPKLSLN
ncbi:MULTISPECIES: hypothetical protein [Vibrio]|uniref:hypothetical protein n=1 Tax=Vibrio TaxID=662 RepID=UPI00078DBADB|nr:MULTISPECIES: hypothetical protein [Vibrio]BAU70848.1 hypothetical protein [Vibrio sp. 04Ya108]BBM67583.1 hypothetical protein VA249_42290 [Vibrio alfacsensis]BCN27066.1 hypothetical protein VYA_42580 [Vibrio alfacsensis]